MPTTLHNLTTVKAQALIDIGMPRAILWNNNLSREVDSQIFIVSTLKRAYNDFVIEKLIVPYDHNKITGVQSLFDGYNLIVFLGIFLVFLGAGAGLLATYRFLKTEKEIMEDTYHPSVIADILVAILLGSIGILLAIYLVHTV